MAEDVLSVNTVWVLLSAALVFFMQAGFAMVETGFTRAKNAGSVIMKNIMNFAICSVCFGVLGFGLMFAGKGPFAGGMDFFVHGDYANPLGLSIPESAYFIFQSMLCAAAAAIVSSVMAERTKFISSCIYSAAVSAVIYPVAGRWIWGGGWLAQMGFHDFAGSAAVHMVGGAAALVGAKMLGPRIGKYDAQGRAKAIPGHNLILGALGVFILWFCWFGFNGGAVASSAANGRAFTAGNVFVATNLSAATSTVTVMVITWVRYKKPDVSITLNGSLAGLVAITAGCDAVTPVGACIIGLIAAFIVVYGVEFIDKTLKIDDPVGAIGVHGLCGAAGAVLTGLFAYHLTDSDGNPLGLFYGGRFGFFGAQLLGVVLVAVWVTVTTAVALTLIKKTVGLRVPKEEETVGLDITENGLAGSYADFMPAAREEDDAGSVKHAAARAENGAVAVEQAVEVHSVPAAAAASDVKLTKIEIITKQTKFEELKNAMIGIGITGMTVTQVLGCGVQKGQTEYYRGVPIEMNLLPKVQVEIVVCKVPVRKVIQTAKKVLYTGHIGDGKIFVYDVRNAVKVRTGEEQCAALQDDAQ